MKRILIYLAISVMFLISSCNINATSSSASSLSASTSMTSSASSSVNDSIVRGITISTTSSTTQVLGLTQKVKVTAVIDGSSVSELEWYLDNIKVTTQLGLEFEFFPNQAKTYQIYSKSGDTISNTLSIIVNLPTINLLSVNPISNTIIEIVGEQGLSFSINGLLIGNNSNYNLSSQKYSLNLLTPMVNGTAYSLKVFKQGYNELTRNFTFENRRLDVAYLQYNSKKIVANSDGSYSIDKPFDDDEDSNPDTTLSMTISMAHSNLEGIAVPVTFSIRNPNNLVDSSKTLQQTRIVTKATNVDHTFSISEEDLIGVYNIEVKVGELTKQIKLNISSPLQSVKLKSVVVFDLADIESNEYVPLSSPFTKVDDEFPYDIVEANSSNEYVVFKPYNGPAYELTFEIEAKNFSIPVIYAGIAVDAHVLTYGIADGKIIRYNSLQDFNSPQGQETFNRNLDGYRITQFIDASTLAGTYTFVFTARLNLSLSSSTTVNYSVTIIIKEYAPDINFDVTYNGELLKSVSEVSPTFILYKPIVGNGIEDGTLETVIEAKIENYESPILPTLRPGVSNLNIDDSVDNTKNRYLLDFNITYSGPVSNIQNLVSRTVIELGQTVDLEDENYVGDGQINDTFEIQEIVSGQQVTKEYNRYIGDDNDVSLDLSEIIPYVTAITSATIPGNHAFTLKIGQVSKTLTIRIVEPVPLIITDENSVLYGPSGSETDTYVEYDEALDTYFVSMSTLEEVDMYLLINVYPFGMTSSPPNYAYTFKKSTPSGNLESVTNFVTLNLKTGDDYDGRLEFPDAGGGSEMKDVIVLADVSGEYLFEYRINNARKVVKVVLLPAPSLEVEEVSFNNNNLVSFNNAYLIEGSNSIRSLTVDLKPVNIKEGFSYTINQIETYAENEDDVIEDDEEDYYDKILILEIDETFSVNLELPAISNISSGEFEQQKYYIRIHDEDDTLVGLTILLIYAQKQ